MALIKKYDGEKETGSLNFEQFLEIMQNDVTLEPEIDEEIYQVYRVFDMDDKGISAEELTKVVNKLIEMKRQIVSAESDKKSGSDNAHGLDKIPRVVTDKGDDSQEPDLINEK